MAATDLCSIDDVKDWLNIQTIASDRILSRLITSVSGFITAWLDRPLIVQSYSEIYDGSGTQVLVLRNTPVVSVASLTVGSLVIPPSPDRITAGYYISDTATSVKLIGYSFPAGRRGVQISYSAGYAEIPEEISQACIEIVALRFKERDRIGEVSKMLPGAGSTSYSQKDMPDSAKTLLQQFRKVTLA